MTITLDELDRLEKAATPGPWVHFDGAPEHGNAYVSGPEPDNWTAAECFGSDPDADAALIAAARNALPGLLAIAQAAQKLLAVCPPWSPEAFTKLHDLYDAMRAAGIEEP